jgi:hypothetical protein
MVSRYLDTIRPCGRPVGRVRLEPALGLGGTIGLGGPLAACGTGGGIGASPTTSATASATATTSAGTDLLALGGRGRHLHDGARGDAGAVLVRRRLDTHRPPRGPARNAAEAGTARPGHLRLQGRGHAGPGGPGGSGGTSGGSYGQGDRETSPTDDGTYLRGAQVADADGIVHATTIYPGWYRGRTVHIHLTVHVDKKTVLTTQLCMDETVNDAVFATAPYGEHTGRETGNDDDHIFDRRGCSACARAATGTSGC